MQWTDYKLLLYSWLKTYSKIAAICSVFNSTYTTISVCNWNCYFRPLSRLRFSVILCSFFTMLNRCAQFSSLQFLFSFCFILCRVLFCRSNVVIFSITFVHVFHRPNLFRCIYSSEEFEIDHLPSSYQDLVINSDRCQMFKFETSINLKVITHSIHSSPNKSTEIPRISCKRKSIVLGNAYKSLNYYKFNRFVKCLVAETSKLVSVVNLKLNLRSSDIHLMEPLYGSSSQCRNGLFTKYLGFSIWNSHA